MPLTRTTPASAGTTPWFAACCCPPRDHPRERGDDRNRNVWQITRLGPPPRARGRRVAGPRPARPAGTTPASAGTTSASVLRTRTARDHPRERGDDVTGFESGGLASGPPPRARGRRGHCPVDPGHRGTTPASAGTTPGCSAPRRSHRDHPRERGDDSQIRTSAITGTGPPPRARGRLRAQPSTVAHARTTPASAGTTEPPTGDGGVSRDHPRERGDDLWQTTPPMIGRGPPPRARGRRVLHRVPGGSVGTTPASAGTTSCSTSGCSSATDHPRERGDDEAMQREVQGKLGPPPRARGRHRRDGDRAPGLGTTPASAGTTCRAPRPARRCRDHPRERGDDAGQGADRGQHRGTTPASAGTTPATAAGSSTRWDHPRERGDDTIGGNTAHAVIGPPPRARGRPGLLPLGGAVRRTTPASAGTTCSQRSP